MRALAFALCLPAPQALADSAQVAAVNALRAEAGRAPLVPAPKLEEAAARHAEDLARSGEFSHQGSDGSDVGARVAGLGYGWCLVAENIAKGHGRLAEVLAAWTASPGHRANLMSPEVTAFGLARAEGNIWVMVLAASGC